MDKTKRAHYFVFGYTILLAFIMFSQAYSFDMDTSSLSFSSSQVLFLKLMQVVSVIFLFVVPSLIYVFYFTDEKLKMLKIDTIGHLYFVFLSIIIFIAAIPFVNYLGELNMNMSFPSVLKNIEYFLRTAEDNVNKMMEMFLSMNTVGDLIINIIVIALAAAVSEELFFRGVLQNHLVKTTGKIHLSVWVTSILFSALHGQFFVFIPRIILGAILGYIYVYSRSLWIPMLGHFLNNGVQVVALYFYLKTHTLADINKMTMGNDSILFVVLSLIGTLLLILFLIKLSSKLYSSDQLEKVYEHRA